MRVQALNFLYVLWCGGSVDELSADADTALGSPDGYSVATARMKLQNKHGPFVQYRFSRVS